MGHDRSSRAERIGANPEHDGVAAAQNAGGIGEDVRATFEDEADDAEAVPDLVDSPAIVLSRLDNAAPAGRCVTP